MIQKRTVHLMGEITIAVCERQIDFLLGKYKV